ncbi:hypothetical protein [Amycolatopsis sp. NPDC049868]|uniref:hypothetical protein n=1 Tax=Amycolatopsis sp. NPDC049868 TaxID=3363934 RepID=UPI0037ABE3E2
MPDPLLLPEGIPPTAARSLPSAVRFSGWTLTCSIVVVLILAMAAAADLLVLVEGQSLTPDIANLGPTGLPAGSLGGWWDRVVTWTADVLLGFPYLIFR